MSRAYRMYINGQWVDAVGGETFEDYILIPGRFSPAYLRAKGLMLKRRVTLRPLPFPIGRRRYRRKGRGIS